MFRDFECQCMSITFKTISEIMYGGEIPVCEVENLEYFQDFLQFINFIESQCSSCAAIVSIFLLIHFVQFQ